MRFCLTKRFILLTCLFLMPYQIVYSDDYYEHNLCDIDNNSRLSLSDIIYGLQVLSGNREEVDVSQEINKTISALVESLRINSNNLSNFHFEKFFHSDFLHEGEDKNLFLSRLSHDLRGENLPENFMLLNDIIKSDLTRKIVTAEIKISFGDLWTVDLKKDIETNEWLFFGDQNKYDYGIRFKIERTYPGGRISRVASVKTRTWNIELEEVKISGPTFLGWHQVKLDYFEQLTFFYTPTESISATNWRYELWSDSFENFPPENSEFSFSMNDGDKVEIFSCFSGPVTHEALEGTGPKDYSIETIKGKEVTFSFTTPQTFTVANVEWKWRANDYGSWKDGTPISDTAAVFNFPSEIEMEGTMQNIDRVMLQAGVIGTRDEKSSVYWLYGYNY